MPYNFFQYDPPLCIRIRGGFSIFIPRYGMFAVFNKPFLSLPQQVALLKARGLQFADETAAEDCLHRNGYYRLSAYWYSFREIIDELDSNGNPVLDAQGRIKQIRTNQFLVDSHFENAQKLYAFDKKFKLLLLDAIERTEIAVRVEAALCVGALDIYAYNNPSFFRAAFKRPRVNRRQPTAPPDPPEYQDWLAKYQTCVRRSKDVFVVHHKDKYGPTAPLPMWKAIELWDFGMLSYFYRGLENVHRDAVTARFAITHSDYMVTWLRSINHVRNVIAHHGRLWNINLVDYPTLPRVGDMPDFDPLHSVRNVNRRMYSVCCVLAHFSKIINPQSSWHKELADLMRTFPQMPYATIQDMGFPADWETHDFWS